MLDRDLATLYQTETRSLKQSVKRNTDKFPTDFMFELNNGDIEILVSQYVITSNFFLGGAKPYAYTNHDRFLIIDQKEMYHIGASLKDLGNKMFGFSKMDAETVKMLNKLKEVKNGD